jgi:hypothetical protein
MSCWRRRRFSASSRARRENRDRIAEQRLDQKRDHRAFPYHTTTRASSRTWFSVGTAADQAADGRAGFGGISLLPGPRVAQPRSVSNFTTTLCGRPGASGAEYRRAGNEPGDAFQLSDGEVRYLPAASEIAFTNCDDGNEDRSRPDRADSGAARPNPEGYATERI